ncbi:MAG: Holliday junction branch migration protein RuvA [Calditrichaeota bacterium]|nr:Holliday junction branch migration protein RuvA [Calditrichota bacterium]
MIDRIRGVLVFKSPTGIVVEVGGIGLALSVPLTTFDKLGRIGEEAALATYLYVREDALELFGFFSTAERDLFRTLIGVQGVGPKMALAILSRFTPEALTQVIAESDLRRLQSVHGVGRKTAERLLIELKDRLGGKGAPVLAAGAAGGYSAIGEAVRALETLGFTIQQAEEAIRRAKAAAGEQATVEDLIKTALKGGS